MKDSQQKKKKRTGIKFPSYFFFLFLTSLAVVCLLILNLDLSNKAAGLVQSNTSFQFRPAVYPILRADLPIDISAGGVAVLDSDSHVILFSKNPTRFFSPASTTKILTSLVGLDYFKLNDILTIYSDDVEGSTVGFKKGEKITFESLLYAMMLPSANDAATAIADNFPGGKDAFVAQMDTKASQLGLSSTHLVDPVGLMDESNITTPQDMAILGDIAMRDQEITKIVKTKDWSIKTLDGRRINLSNLNILLGKDGVEGVKTGYTETSGEVLVTSKKTNGKRVIIVVMQSEDRFGDTEKIMKRLDAGLTYLNFQP